MSAADPVAQERTATLKAGRELDALIARNVMGLGVGEVGVHLCEIEVSGQHIYALRIVKHYSTDIAAAWPVHVNILERPFSVRRLYLDALQRLASELVSRGTGKAIIVAWPDVLAVLCLDFPEYICLAALKAVEISDAR